MENKDMITTNIEEVVDTGKDLVFEVDLKKTGRALLGVAGVIAVGYLGRKAYLKYQEKLATKIVEELEEESGE